MTAPPTPADRSLALGPEDLALLARLRAVALLFRAARSVVPALRGIDIFLLLYEGQIHFFSATAPASRLIATAAGFTELLDAARSNRMVFDAVRDHLTQCEFATGCPPALLRLLTHLQTAPPDSALSAALAQRGWVPDIGALRVVLTDAVSSHEGLEIVLALGDNRRGAVPLAVEVYQAALSRAEGGRT